MTSKVPFSAFLSLSPAGGLGSPPHLQRSMRAACASPQTMAQDLRIMPIPWSGPTKVRSASYDWRGPLFSLLVTIPCQRPWESTTLTNEHARRMRLPPNDGPGP